MTEVQCRWCGQRIVHGPHGWVHLPSPTSHGNYVACAGQDGYPPVRKAQPKEDWIGNQ